jgi:putative transposase
MGSLQFPGQLLLPVGIGEGFQRWVPEIFNSDQGSQFTSEVFTSRLEIAGIRISWDGRVRVWDNIFIERLWRSAKWEEVYLKDYADVPEAIGGLGDYFRSHWGIEHPNRCSLGRKTLQKQRREGKSPPP